MDRNEEQGPCLHGSSMEADREENGLVDALGTRLWRAALRTIESAAESEIGPNFLALTKLNEVTGAGTASCLGTDLDLRCLHHPLTVPRIDPEQMEAAVWRRGHRDVVSAEGPSRCDFLIRPVRLFEERDWRCERLASVGRRNEVQLPGILGDRGT